MNNGRFQIFLRRRQNQSEYPPGSGITVNVIVHCAPLTGWAEYIPGTVDNVTPFEGVVPVDGWYEFSGLTKDSGGIEAIEPDFKLSFTWDKVNSGDSSNTSTSQDGSNYDKGITSEFTFFDAAYRFIYDWLLLTECSILNTVEVKIIDLIARGNNPDPAGNYRIFEIKSDNIEYAPVDEPCQFHIKLREQDNNWHCIHKNTIWDNWQNWFNATGTSVKDHPCFLTCIEPRPRLVNSARMAIMMFYHSHPLVKLVAWITGQGNIIDNAREILNANKFVDSPLVRTYIENIAGKCGLSMDTIFDVGKDWENLCLFYPQAGQMYENNAEDDSTFFSPALHFHFDNRWLITIAELFDKLKIVFAAEWYVTPLNTIVFKYTKDLINLLPIYDFTLPGSEPVYNIRYTFNGDKKPAYGRYEYEDDGSDLASQEMSTLYSDIVDYDGPANNPMLEGERVKNFEFAPTGFIRDGRSKDYLNLLIKDGKIGALVLMAMFEVILLILQPSEPFTLGSTLFLGINLFIWIGLLLQNATKLKNEFVDNPTYTGAVRLTSEQVLTPRLLLWDGISEQRAKVVQRVGLPVPNPYYNPLLTPYNVKNQIQEDNPQAVVYNYPLYIDGDFYGNLYDKYHDVIDNPLKSLETHQNVSWKVELCESMLNLFGVFQNQYAQIGKVVKLEHRDGYDVYVRIGNINVDYDTSVINIRGTVMRRKTESVDDTNPGNTPVVTPESASGGIINPDDVCLKWINIGTEDANAAYRDCNGINLFGQIISPQESFCAFELYSYAGGNIVASDTCQETSASGSAAPPPEACEKFYVANLREIEGLDPEVIVYENTIGNIVWTRTGIGEYTGTLVGAFPIDLTWMNGSEPVVIGQGEVSYFFNSSTDFVVIRVVDGAGAASDAALGEALASFEIRTYCCENGATADAGIDQTICFTDTVSLSGSVIGTAESNLWTTSGDGTFDDATLLNAVYTPGSGDISGGTVTLTLTVTSTCPDSSDEMIVTINPTPVATFDYTVPNASSNYCQALPSNPAPLGNPFPNFTGGGVAGVFTADPGLIFVDGSPSPTGQVDIANTPPGTYTVTNTLTNSCGTDIQTASITILALPVEGISYPPETFTTADADQTVVFANGSFFGSFSAPAGLTIDGGTGTISPSTSTPGTYTITYTYTSATCPNSTTVNVTIT